MIEDRICAFCYRQNEFILLITKLHLVKPIGSGILKHPLTDNFLAQVLDYKTYKPINYIIHKINAMLMDSDGMRNVKQLQNMSMLE